MPLHQFQDYSTSLIHKPGVADACLFVRDRYGLNVNLILFCAWLADSGNGPLSTEAISAVMSRVADWEQQVVAPLRDIHRSCRHEPLGVPEYLLQEFEPQIESAEQEAGKVEQLMLADLARGLFDQAPRDGDGSVEPADAAVHSLEAYLQALKIDQDTQLTECLSVVLRAAFNGACFPGAHRAAESDNASSTNPA